LKIHHQVSALSLLVAAGWAVPARADDSSEAAIRQQIAEMRAQMQQMAARIDSLESQLQAARARADAAESKASAASAAVAALPYSPAAPASAKPATETAWKGAPEFATADGWTFKPRGRLHLDAGTISTPGAFNTSRTLGGEVRVRRVRLGFEGTMPGGFGYKIEGDFANAGVAFGDVFVSYSPPKTSLLIRVGNLESLNGMEQITSSNNISFLERAAFNDAFLNARRLGAALAWQSKDKAVRAEAGLFAAHGIDSSLDNNGWIGAARLVYAPRAMGGQLHFGLSYQHRDFASNAGGVASSGVGMPSTNQLARYRARPNTQLTDVRFVDTGNFAARSDRIIGAELAGVFKGLYFTGEAQWLRADAYAAGNIARGLDQFTDGNTAVVPTGNPGFFGAYGEIGYFLTGETRAYRQGEGIWGRTKVLHPLSKGGSGAFQVAARFEYVDLDDDELIEGPTNNFTTGSASLGALSARQGRGGKQKSFLLGLNWYPMDYMRLMVNYGRIEIEGGPIAAQVSPLSVLPVNQRDYGVNLLQTRLQFEF
jgi:phosphate-selective porin OprO/OprP